uniref:Core Histone H2A/H2B/H3 domain-containing protein n=1 Tax=Macaca mulatta TaxID=9544 RepID=A0A5F7ZSQ8_MACMU
RGIREHQKKKELCILKVPTQYLVIEIAEDFFQKLRYNSTQVGVFKKANQIGLTCLLQSTNSCALEAQKQFVKPKDDQLRTRKRGERA